MNAVEIAKQRCEKLLRMAKQAHAKEPALAKRYVALARKIAMRHRFSLGNKSFCKKCGTVFVPGSTLKVRLSKGLQLYTCVSCGFTRRFPFKPNKQKE